MSKSLGNVVDPLDVIERLGVPALRYFFARHMRTGSDSAVSLELIANTYNSELANKFGNLLARLTKFARTRLGEVVPDVRQIHVEDQSLLEEALLAAIEGNAQLQNVHTLAAGTARIFGIVERLNDLLSEVAPWSLISNPQERGRVESIVYVGLECLRLVFEAFWPISPETSRKGLEALGLTGEMPSVPLVARKLKPGALLGPSIVLFPRIG